jgi:hypoxanthine phosphoribosyltransferase
MYQVGKVLFESWEIARKVEELGRDITRDYRDKDIAVVGVLKGCTVFLADLLRTIKQPVTIDFIQVTSYAEGTNPTPIKAIHFSTGFEVTGKDVLLVEDIIDTGITADYILRQLKGKEPASLRLCVLLNKPDRRRVAVPLDYVGFQIPNRFIVGYGLDYKEQFRNLPYLAFLK